MTAQTPRTRAEAIAAAGQLIAMADEMADTLPLAEAVDAAYTPTGPAREELARRIHNRPNRIGSADELDHYLAGRLPRSA